MTAADPVSPHAAKPERTVRESRGGAYALLAAVQIVLILAITIVSVPLPAIGRDLGLDQAQLVLVSAAYGVAFSGLLLLGGRLTELLGHRRALRAGVAVFGAASAAAAVSPGFASLLAARLLQGAGGALAAPAALALVGVLFPEPPRRARALAVWGMLPVTGAVAGILLSGPLLESASWRWTFAVPALVAATVAALAPRALPAGAATQVHRRLDVLGALLATGGLFALSTGLVASGEVGWGDPRTFAPVAVGVGLLVAFTTAERRGTASLLPLALLRSRRRVAALLIVGLTATPTAATFLFLALDLQMVRGASPLGTSAAFGPFAAALLVSSYLAPRAVARLGGGATIVAGLLMAAAGLALIGRTGVAGAYAGPLLAGLVLFPAGAALAFSGATVAALDGVGDGDAGPAGGVLNTALETGAAAGLAVLVALAGAATTPADRADGHGFALTVAAAALAVGAALLLLLGKVRGPATATRAEPSVVPAE
jgi:MFS family permease